MDVVFEMTCGVCVFHDYDVVHCSWHREFLFKCQDAAIPLFPALVPNWIGAAVSQGASGIPDRVLVNEFTKVLQRPTLAAVAVVLQIMGHIIGRSAHKLESCLCHEDLLLEDADHTRDSNVGDSNRAKAMRLEGSHGSVVGDGGHGGVA